jgi:hypothetical protein
MKYLVYNIENNTKVKLELFIDTITDGNGAGGGFWEKVGEAIDCGDWPAAFSAITGCNYSDPSTIITEGHGTILLRTDGDGAEYKMVSIREIDIEKTAISVLSPDLANKKSLQRTISARKQFNLLGRILTNRNRLPDKSIKPVIIEK